MRRVLFLDIDGVLNHGLHPLDGPAPDPRDFDPECVRRVRRVAHGAAIVLASSWPEDVAAEVLGRHGIDLFDALDDDRITYEGRPIAILRWLAAHPDVTAWVAVDDDRMRLSWRDKDGSALGAEPWRLVRTDPDTGIGERECDAAQVVLYENRAPLMPPPGPPNASLPCDECRSPSVYVDDHLPQYDPLYGCAVHAWPAPNVSWRPTSPADRYDKRGRRD